MRPKDITISLTEREAEVLQVLLLLAKKGEALKPDALSTREYKEWFIPGLEYKIINALRKVRDEQ